jgi:hypothetical protein
MERVVLGWQKNPIFEVGQQWAHAYDNCPWDIVSIVTVTRTKDGLNLELEDSEEGTYSSEGMEERFPGSKFFLVRESIEKVKKYHQ